MVVSLEVFTEVFTEVFMEESIDLVTMEVFMEESIDLVTMEVFIDPVIMEDPLITNLQLMNVINFTRENRK